MLQEILDSCTSQLNNSITKIIFEMRNLSKFSLMLMLSLFAANVFAQNAEEIITESTVPAEDIYIDDVVSKRLLRYS